MSTTHLIHIGLAFEFQQPLLLAEGLAHAAVHHDWWYTDYLSAAEEAASRAEETPMALDDIIDAERADPKISTASAYEYHSQIRKHSGRWAMDPCMSSSFWAIFPRTLPLPVSYSSDIVPSSMMLCRAKPGFSLA